MKPLQALTPLSRLRIAVGIVLLTVPGYAQYYSNDLTPPAASSGKLHGTSQGKQVGGASNSHAYLLSGNALTAIDLHPATGYYSTMATSTDGIEQCGFGSSYLGGIHAVKWSSSSTSAVDLHPSGFNFSYCTGVDNGQQGGFAEQQSYFVSMSHAMLWNGNSAATDLHPLGYTFSRVMGLRSGEQVGYASTLAYPYGDYPNGPHTTSKALRWNGTAASVVSLHPLGYDASEALATNGVQQGGWGYRAIDGRTHAMLWSGTAESAIDLHPAGYSDTKVNAVTATQQVGEGLIGFVRHALAWSGTAQSVIDLNQYLPAGYANGVATGVDSSGNIVGYAYNTYNQGMSVGGDSIAVIFAPGQAPATAVASLTLSPSNVAPGSIVQATVSLGAPAPAAGTTLTFLSTNLALLATPAPVTIPAGQISTALSLSTLGTALTAPATVKLYVTDGVSSKIALLTVTPIVGLSALNVNAVEGGLSTSGTVTLNIPAQLGGATVTLTSSNTALVRMPAAASVLLPIGYQTLSFAIATSPVTTITQVPVTATFNGTSVTTNVSLNPAPVVTVSSITGSSVVGGQPLSGTVVLSNYVRDAAGAVITLSSGNAGAVQMPASVVIPQGYQMASFNATTSVVPGTTGVSLKATYNGSQATTTVSIAPVPTVTILRVDYKPDLQLLKVDATTSYANSTLTYGTNGVPFGTMQLKLGVYSGSILMAVPPTTVTVWNSNGGQATVPVVISIPGGGASGGGGGSATGPFKIVISKNGKGTVTANPNAATYASGTVVTLTATPDPGSPWVGWQGACTGTATTCTLTMDSDKSVTANFK